MSEASSSPPRSASEPPLPSPAVQGVVSLVVVIHLFAIFVGAFSNQLPISREVQPLRVQLRRTPGLVEYLQTLGMDFAFNHRRVNFMLTGASLEDVDHYVDIVRDWEDPFAESPAAIPADRKLPLEPAGPLSTARKGRYLNLALSVALNTVDEDLESTLPQTIINRLMAENAIQGGRHRFRCRAQLLQEPGNVDAGDPSLRDPYHERWFDDVYQADVVPGDGRWLLSKVAGRGEVTRVRQSR